MSANISNNLFRQGPAQIYSTQTYLTIQVLEVGRSPHLAEPGAAALEANLPPGSGPPPISVTTTGITTVVRHRLTQETEQLRDKLEQAQREHHCQVCWNYTVHKELVW